jgi:ABC-type uncharacterized transport system ATPase subunit
VDGLTSPGLSGTSFVVHAGEIFGIAGIVERGAELVRAITEPISSVRSPSRAASSDQDTRRRDRWAPCA